MLVEARDINGLDRLPLDEKVRREWIVIAHDLHTLAGIYDLPKLR